VQGVEGIARAIGGARLGEEYGWAPRGPANKVPQLTLLHTGWTECLKVHSQAKFDLALLESRGDLSKVAGTESCGNSTEARMIPDVEKL